MVDNQTFGMSCISSLTFLPGFLPLSQEGDPHPAGQHDHGVEAVAQRPDDPERVLRDPQRLHQQLQVLALQSFLDSQIFNLYPHQGNGEIRGHTRKGEGLGAVFRGHQYHQVIHQKKDN